MDQRRSGDQSNYLFAQGITSGCAATKLCPDENLDRSTAAVERRRRIHQRGQFHLYDLALFHRCTCDAPSFKWIRKMKDLGITSGCTAARYCPDNKLQNFEIAISSVRARQFLETGLAIPSTFSFSPMPYFSDETLTADPTHSGNFCATNYTTRAQSLPISPEALWARVSENRSAFRYRPISTNAPQ